MEKITALFRKTRARRLMYRRTDPFCAAVCAVKEEAYLDALKALGATAEEIRVLRNGIP